MTREDTRWIRLWSIIIIIIIIIISLYIRRTLTSGLSTFSHWLAVLWIYNSSHHHHHPHLNKYHKFVINQYLMPIVNISKNPYQWLFYGHWFVFFG